jgi:hypothetical protein
MQQRGEVEHGAEFVFGGLHYDEIVIRFGALHFGGNIVVNFREGCGRPHAGCSNAICIIFKDSVRTAQ